MWAASIALSMVLAALAWRYAAAHPRHRPAAAFLTLQLVGDIARQAISILNAPAYAAAHGAPLEGLARFRFHLGQLLFLSWPFGLAAVAALVFLDEPRRRRAAALSGFSWPLCSLALALAYPTVRGALLARVYLAAELLALVAVFASGLAWWRRREEPSLVEGSVGVLAAVEIVALLRWAPFSLGWDWQTVAYLCGYVTLTCLHMGELWLPKSSSSS